MGSKNFFIVTSIELNLGLLTAIVVSTLLLLYRGSVQTNCGSGPIFIEL